VLSSKRHQRGVSLTELIIGLAITAILFLLALPDFRVWIQNAKIRGAAESIKTGLVLARTEALRRNAPVHFSLVSSLDNDCELSTTTANWVVSMLDPTGGCGVTPASGPTDDAPRIIQLQSQAVGSAEAVIASDQSSVTFNGLGQLTTSAANICIGITNVLVPPDCSAGTNDHHLQIVVTTGGQIRMCDPAHSLTTDPQGC
jgi:type IV fimbrial biogenesis protein FimT